MILKKPRIGVFKYSCCAGCEFQLIYFQKYILETLGAADIIYCQMLQSDGIEEGPFDIALIEGAITETWQADQLKKVRKASTHLIAIGTCAVCGGIPAIKNNQNELEVETRVYPDTSALHSIKAHPVEHYVKVDGSVKGCPMGERDLTELVLSLLLKKNPDFLESSVCVECKLKGNICLLVAYNEPCMGPVTNAGCDALCPSYNRACFSCFGPLKDANSAALAAQLLKMGQSPEDIFRRFTEFGQPTIEFQTGANVKK
ncbi:MAG: oxidoreductase [Candidatus Wallbacteria bacterium]|nr:oxidoreductase [Candidatus Wallbacteria bacterium]